MNALPTRPEELPRTTTGTPLADYTDQAAAALAVMGEGWRVLVDAAPRLQVAWQDHPTWHDVVLLLDEDGDVPVAALVRVEPDRWLRHGWSLASVARVWRSHPDGFDRTAVLG